MTDNIAVSFFSKEVSYDLPDDTFNIPTSTNVENLNTLVNTILENKEVNFDFIVDDVIITTTIADYLTYTGKTNEGILKLECIGKQNPPRPDKDIPHNDWVGAVKTTNDHILSGTFDGILNVWNHNGENIFKKEISSEAIKCMTVSSDGKYIITGHQDQTLALSEISMNGKKIELTTTAIFRGHARSVDCVDMMEDKIVSGSYDGTLKVWNTDLKSSTHLQERNTKKQKLTAVTKTPLVTLLSHKEGISGVSWNNENKKQVATVSWDHTIILWDLDTSTVASTIGANKSFTSISMHPTSATCITGSVDPIARIYDLRCNSGAMVKCSFQSHKSWISVVKWSPTKENLFITGSYDNTVKMWDIRSPKANLYDLLGHEDRVLCADWSNPEIIASGSVDATVKTFRT